MYQCRVIYLNLSGAGAGIDRDNKDNIKVPCITWVLLAITERVVAEIGFQAPGPSQCIEIKNNNIYHVHVTLNKFSTTRAKLRDDNKAVISTESFQTPV